MRHATRPAEPSTQLALQGAHEVQAQAPGEAAVAGAVPVLGPSGQVGAFDGLSGASALHRRGIHDPHVIAPYGGVGGQQPGHPPQQLGCLAQALVVAGLLRQVGEQMPQVSTGVAQPLGLGRLQSTAGRSPWP